MTARDRRTCDIARGSTWIAREGEGSALVVRVCAGWVFFADASGAMSEMYYAQFRARFSEPYDAQQCRSQFSMSLANLANFHAFWSPSQRRMPARSATAAPDEMRGAARGRPALPDDAQYLGTYAIDEDKPRGPVDAFLEDLNDLIAAGLGRIRAI